MTHPEYEKMAREIAYECSKDLGMGGTGWGKNVEFVQKALQACAERQIEKDAEIVDSFEKNKWMVLQSTLKDDGTFQVKTFMDVAQAIRTQPRGKE